MKSKYIKGTDKQYSIREDGVVLSNRISRALKENTKTKNSFVDIYINKRQKRVRPNLLLAEYFKVKKCLSCNEIKDLNLFKGNLNDCRFCRNKKEYIQKKETGQMMKASKNKTKRATKSYIANKILRIKTSELSEELYLEVKRSLLFKRKVVKEHKVNYQLLN